MDYKFWWEKAISFNEYLKNFEHELNHGSSKQNADKLPINWQRTSRILKTYVPSDEVKNIISSLSESRKWIVITEHWCGDSAQIIPVMQKIIESSDGKIEMRLIYRDDYPEFMDAHLTNGGRSIPKLIQLNQNWQVLNFYGPRPEYAMNLVRTLKSNPETTDKYSEELHKWYAQDKQKSIELDLVRTIAAE